MTDTDATGPEPPAVPGTAGVPEQRPTGPDPDPVAKPSPSPPAVGTPRGKASRGTAHPATSTPPRDGRAGKAAKPTTRGGPMDRSAGGHPQGQPTAGEQPLRILVAEDEALIRLDLVEMLADAGYEVAGQATDGEQAVTLAREVVPDLVLMDVQMPGLDGISAAETIGREKIAPVVMLTAFSQKELVERARDAGVMAYIVKPFTQSDLGPAIDIARHRWLEVHALEAEVADLGERLETRKAVDRAKGILMNQLHIGEAEAFRWIQKTAMDRRLGMREVADAVVAGLPSKTT